MNIVSLAYTNKKETKGVTIQNVDDPSALGCGALFEWLNSINLTNIDSIRIADKFGNISTFKKDYTIHFDKE